MASTLGRITLFSFLFLLFVPRLTSAEIKTFIKEYTYQASEDDSRNSSRTIALREVKRLLLEELGTYLESITEVQNFQLTKDQITTLTAGIVKTEIIEERWDGGTYWLKSKIAADSDNVIKSIDAIRNDREKTKQLEEIRKRSDEQFREIERLRKDLLIVNDQNRRKEKAAYDETIKNIAANEWFEKGYASSSASNYNDAIDAFSKGIELNPKYARAYNYRALMYSKLGDYNNARKDFDKIIELNPKDASTYNNRGFIYAALGDPKKAMQDYDKAIVLDPKDASAYRSRGDLFITLGNRNRAMQDYDKAIVLDPKDELSYWYRANAYWKLGNSIQAIEDYGKGIELNPKLEIAYYGRALAYLTLGNRNQAIKDFSKAIELNPKDSSSYIDRGDAYAALGNTSMAMEDYNKIIEIESNPKDASAYRRRGSAHIKLGNYNKAIADYSKAVELDPKNALLNYLFRGDAYNKLGDYNKAIQDFSKSIELNPGNASAYNNRGLAYIKLGNYNKAIRDLSKSIELNPKEALAYAMRGGVYGKLGDKNRAIEDLKIAARLGLKEAQDMLKSEGITWTQADVPITGKTDKPNEQPVKSAESKQATKQAVELAWKNAQKEFYAAYPDYASNKALNYAFINIVNEMIQSPEVAKMTDWQILIEAKRIVDDSVIFRKAPKEEADQRYKGIKAIALQNGTVVEGQIISMNTETVKIRTKDGKISSYSFKEEVQKFIKE
jgi:tetratricopeptide (TPR) repeat protein